LPPKTQIQPFRHVAIVGPGAIGCCLAVRLALAPGGPKVTLIDHRADRAARLSARPIRIHEPGGDAQARIPVRTAPDAPVGLVLLATKAYAARAAAGAAAAWVGAAPVVCLQNGLGVAQEVAAALPRTAVITAVSYQAATLVAEGEVHHAANLMTHFGYEGRGPDAAVRAAADLFERAGLPAAVEADMTPCVWGKLIINAAINPVAALAGATNGEVALRPTLRALAAAIAQEGEAAARAAGAAIPYSSAAEAALETARQTAGNRCSMLQDLEAGRPTEIDYLNGAIVRAAQAHGAAAPANRAIAALIRQVSAVW
jgi:2-dehydropantoate 2-reductase